MASPHPPALQALAAPVQFGFSNTYARLPERFYARVNPTPVAAPRLIQLNAELARELNLDPAALTSEEGEATLSGNRIAAGSEPLAEAYAGHQFGHFVPQLGDGRANLLGEVLSRDGTRYDIQLKGSGPTPFSRRGDGRAALGPVLREYLVSEAMAALGVPTTRALAAVATGQTVVRETIQPGAVFTRVAASHIRVGTFQYFAARGDTDGVRILADYALSRHYPETAQSPHPFRALLEGVIARQAALIAQWLSLGFIHGVMNTDNMAISGETIDFGPCAFMEAYDPSQVFSSIDVNGRYGYSNQPAAALWNLMRLAESLLPLLFEEAGSEAAGLAAANDALAAFEPQFEAARNAAFRRKLGLVSEREGDAALVDHLLARMAANHADFTLTFRHLADIATDLGATQEPGAPSKLRLGGSAAPDSEPDPCAPRAEEGVLEIGRDFSPGITGAESERALAPGTCFSSRSAQDRPLSAASAASPLFADPTFNTWTIQWRARLALEPASPDQIASTMRRANPTFIPRNHLVQAVIDAAALREDFRPFADLLAVVTHPFDSADDRPDLTRYATPARPEERVTQTFCGT